MRCGIGDATLLLLVFPLSVPAQQPLAATGGLSVTEHRVDAGFGVERTLGPVVSAGIALRASPRLSLAFHARAGALAARGSGAIDRDFGELALTAQWRATSRLGADVAAITRSYASTVGRQHWFLVRAGGELRVPLGWGGSAGVFRLGYLPVVRAYGLDAPRLAFAASAGMEYQLGRARVRGAYELERYDFPPAGTTRRLEQLSALSVSVAVGLRRAH